MPRDDGSLFPPTELIRRDLATMAEAGFTVLRTYTPPPDDLIELASEHDLQILPGVFFLDWRYLLGSSRRQVRRITAEAVRSVRAEARRLRTSDHVLALCLGNEIPADVLRWVGTRTVEEAIARLADTVRDVDDSRLVTYANYPTAEYLALDSVDFLTFNVFLERRTDFRRYLSRLHNLAGDRPLVLGEIGVDAGGDEGETAQADLLDWQLETALERGVAGTCVFSWTDDWAVGGVPVEDWSFGLTRSDRSPRQALRVVSEWNQRDVADLVEEWPTISVVVCAYNAAPTLEECLRNVCELDYPGLEVIVVDDGSTDSSAEIAARFHGVKVVGMPHRGLSAARNEGLRASSGEMVAYLDSDAYPGPEWPYYLALGMDGPRVGGVGGPNLPPPEDPLPAQAIAAAPGGPVHVLLTDDRAEHIPGCNMAFWRSLLEEVGGFDTVYTAAGDDVDLCWKVLDRGWEIAFHPAALVWHHRRVGVRPYLRQQRGYGRAEALVEARHPDRFTPMGTARWKGRLYAPMAPARGRQRIYRGLYGAAAYQSVYRGQGVALDLAHQVGVPLAAISLLTVPFIALSLAAAVPAAAGALVIVLLAMIDFALARPPRRMRTGRLHFRFALAFSYLLQPLARTWGRARHQALARKGLPCPEWAPQALARRLRGSVLLLEDRPRAEVAEALIATVRRAGLRVMSPSGWEDYDARFVASALLFGDLVTSAYPGGVVQARIRRRWRWLRVFCCALAGATILSTIGGVAAGAIGGLCAFSLCRGWLRTRPRVLTVRSGTASP